MKVIVNLCCAKSFEGILWLLGRGKDCSEI